MPLANLSIDASTWQADLTVRLAGIDERELLSSREPYGRACFFGEGLKLLYDCGAFKRQADIPRRGPAGAAGPSALNRPADPFTLWVDVALQRHLNETKVMLAACYGDSLSDVVDSADATALASGW